jgi:hypothetical protein
VPLVCIYVSVFKEPTEEQELLWLIDVCN